LLWYFKNRKWFLSRDWRSCSKTPNRDVPSADERINHLSILSYTLSTNMGFRKGRSPTFLHFGFGRLTKPIHKENTLEDVNFSGS
jgi:hypothetical protein